MESRVGYRADIDGLRAIAVLAVVLYHADIRIFSGGYVGVDIFFVISGYLITTIIVREIEANDFSIFKFYERRIRRIYPALYAVIAFTLLVAAILYDPKNFKATGKSIMATTGFMSNMLFWSESGYFDTASTLKLMLHTWSLAVEEQFYIVFPLLIVLIMRFARSWLKQILAVLALVSFGFSVYYARQDASAAFYLAHLRAWELMIGSLLAIHILPAHIHPKLANALSLAGIAMIAASIFLYTDSTIFPGESALLPTIGAALIIYSGTYKNSLAGNFLSLPPVVFIGKISYSLYLWHWPVILFGKYYLIREATESDMILLLLVCFILSVLSWYFIENPFREKKFLKTPKIFIFAGSVMAVALMVGGIVYFNNGFPGRFRAVRASIAPVSNSESKKWSKCVVNIEELPANLTLCHIGEKLSSPKFIFWGDSHALALAIAVNASAQKEGVSGYLATTVGCPPLLGVDRDNEHICYEYNNKIIEYVEAHPELTTVVLASRWALSASGERYKAEKGQSVTLVDMDKKSGLPGTNAAVFEVGLQRTVQKLTELNRKVVIVMSVPEVGYNVPSSYFMALRTNRDINQIIGPTLDEYLERNHTVISVMNTFKNNPNVEILYPSEVLCNENICEVVANGKTLYQDDDHLSAFGSHYISRIFNSTFSELSLGTK